MKSALLALISASTSSRLSEASGLKLVLAFEATDVVLVSPLRGEWIEIFYSIAGGSGSCVSPLRGEWIEIRFFFRNLDGNFLSRLSEASGLK